MKKIDDMWSRVHPQANLDLEVFTTVVTCAADVAVASKI